jgi:aspartate/methionine/tyrosine aminotransferase
MPGVRCSEPEGAFYLFPDIRGTGLSSEEFAWGLLEKGKVATLPGSAFGACGEGYVRLACTRSLEVLAEGMDRMEAFVKSLKG